MWWKIVFKVKYRHFKVSILRCCRKVDIIVIFIGKLCRKMIVVKDCKSSVQWENGSYMVRIAIVEDEQEFAETVEKHVRAFFKEKQEQVYTFRCNSKELLQEMKEQRNFDIYLFDIIMPDMNGVDLGEQVLGMDPHGKIIFLTSHGEYALQGIRMRIYYYILKDSWWEELSRILEFIWREEEENREEFRCLRIEEEKCRLLVNDILYLTKEKKYTVYHCLDRSDQGGWKIYKERVTLEMAYARLPQDRFLMIIKGVIVNMKHVIRTEGMNVVMRDGEIFPISKNRRNQIQDQMAKYWGEK